MLKTNCRNYQTDKLCECCNKRATGNIWFNSLLYRFCWRHRQEITEIVDYSINFNATWRHRCIGY